MSSSEPWSAAATDDSGRLASSEVKQHRDFHKRTKSYSIPKPSTAMGWTKEGSAAFEEAVRRVAYDLHKGVEQIASAAQADVVSANHVRELRVTIKKQPRHSLARWSGFALTVGVASLALTGSLISGLFLDAVWVAQLRVGAIAAAATGIGSLVVAAILLAKAKDQ